MTSEGRADENRQARDSLWLKLSELDPAIYVEVDGGGVTMEMDRTTAERLAALVKP